MTSSAPLKPQPLPPSLRAVSEMVCAGADYAMSMKEFIDGLIRAAQAAGGVRDGVVPIASTAFSDEPLPLADPVLRAHLAGVAEHIAFLSGQAPPSWASEAPYFLPEPVVLGGSHSRQHMLTDTPSAFRRRLLFCGPVLGKLVALLGMR